MELRARVSSAKRELARVRVGIQKAIEAIKEGFVGPELKGEMDALQARKAELTRNLESADELPPLLHPDIAERWRAEITELRDALVEDRCDPEARETVRNMVEEIRLTPREGVLAVDVKGNLAAMLKAASPNEDWPGAVTMVAGGDLNPRPLGYEPNELPTAPPRVTWLGRW